MQALAIPRVEATRGGLPAHHLDRIPAHYTVLFAQLPLSISQQNVRLKILLKQPQLEVVLKGFCSLYTFQICSLNLNMRQEENGHRKLTGQIGLEINSKLHCRQVTII